MIKDFLRLILLTVFEIILFPFKLIFGRKKDKVGFMSKKEKRKFLKKSNSGIIIDSDRGRLTEKISCQHLFMIAPSGMGKTQSFIWPNLAQMDNCSLIITDPKGTTFRKYASVLSKRGFNVTALNMITPSESFHYNPLTRCKDDYEKIDSIAQAVLSGHKDEFWKDNALPMINYFSNLILNLQDDSLKTLRNLSILVDKMGSAASNKEIAEQLSAIMAEHIKDDYLFNKFHAHICTGEKTLGGIASTAGGALSKLISPELNIISSTNDLPLDNLRKEKTAIFIMIPPGRSQRFYHFMSLFFTDLFNSLMDKIPENNDLPVYCLLDEFGNISKIPEFDSIISQIREYKVSISLIVQSLSQIKNKYDKASDIIIENCSTKIICPGLTGSVPENTSRLLGQIKVDDEKYSKERPLITPPEIRMLNEEAIIICSNKKPIKVPFKPVKKNRRLRKIKGNKNYQPNWPEIGDIDNTLDLSQYNLKDDEDTQEIEQPIEQPIDEESQDNIECSVSNIQIQANEAELLNAAYIAKQTVETTVNNTAK
ncbi:MAG: type IV secretion system protein VirD4 [Candidatus Magnetoglobus multicellularis str. Araruama]|uniref:Type IV secretion system protein VirD4 n=1 Tax=Candidatus Magnetoglobus multicellularis str. Araruama TaxID=890399 RepID=A0A1V1P0S9_9BACT|nr:MAG: type IV secretion system protein VirD4 [Candidatus Magnetoglobus multicellularis str. Araruama]